MARVAGSDERGAVYVEFLIAFFPMFLLFLGLCQLALVAAAEAVVRHAAFSAVRSAIVTLDDRSEELEDVECGNVLERSRKPIPRIAAIVEKLSTYTGSTRAPSSRSARTEQRFRFGIGTALESIQSVPDAVMQAFGSQHGARMVPIRAAALLPLLPLAPKTDGKQAKAGSVVGALQFMGSNQLTSALEYTEAATAVTVHDTEGTDALAVDAFEADALVTIHVRYLFRCNVPVVRMLMCQSLEQTASKDGLDRQARNKLSSLADPGSRFKLLSATATLPNQGAHYYPRQP